MSTVKIEILEEPVQPPYPASAIIRIAFEVRDVLDVTTGADGRVRLEPRRLPAFKDLRG